MINRKKTHHIFKPENSIPIIILIVILGLTIGYAAFHASLDINDISALVRVERDMRVTSISANTPTSGAVSHWEDYNVSSISSSVTLPNSDSTITYDVAITNIGNIEGGISQINGLPNNLTYSISNYTLNTILCDDNDSTKCKLGSVTTLHITIGYAPGAYDSSNTEFVLGMDFTFYFLDAVAKIGNTYYDTLQEAVDAVPTDGTATTVILLKDTSELITVSLGQNVVFDLQNNTISNMGANPIIENYGSISISNGTLSTTTTQGAINNNSGATLNMSGGRILASGNKQTIYNNGGTVTISGSTYLKNTSKERPAITNLSNSTLTILGGTIIAERHSAISNEGTLTIGTKDGSINTNSPVLQGFIYGVTSTTNYSFYDGIVKGKTDVFNDDSKITDKETDYGIHYKKEIIDGNTYKTGNLAIIAVVIFNPNTGTVDETTRTVEKGKAIGTLPIPTKEEYVFDGWFTDPSTGQMINDQTIINSDTEYFAHWTHESEVYVAKIGNTLYSTLQNAINAVPANTQTTIQLIRNAIENVTTTANKNIILDLQNFTLNNSNNDAVIANGGTLTLANGTIVTNSTSTAAINNTGNFTMNSGRVLATGLRQALYNNGGTATISGSAYLSATTTLRAVIHNLASSNMTITGGTIVSTGQDAINNAGTLTIGVKDGNIDTTAPVMQGKANGITNTNTFKFYDGIMKGKTAPLSGNISDIEQNSNIVNSTEVIDGTTYHTAYLS
ncbi:MAG: InlB B-repeat-containing protein [Bacilli bacterium]|nr:InlB B-repeat-containing protein [Bacilli bacterium]